MAQALDSRSQFDEDTEVRDVGHLAGNLISDSVGICVFLPLVRQKLFHRERNSLVRHINGGHNRVDFLTLLNDLGGMVDSTGPRHVRNMNQTVDARHDFYESSEISEIPNNALDPASDVIGVCDGFPRISLGRPQR